MEEMEPIKGKLYKYVGYCHIEGCTDAPWSIVSSNWNDKCSTTIGIPTGSVVLFLGETRATAAGEGVVVYTCSASVQTNEYKVLYKNFAGWTSFTDLYLDTKFKLVETSKLT